MSKRGRDDEHVTSPSMTVDEFSSKTLGFYEAMCAAEGKGRRYVREAREGVLNACIKYQHTEVTVELLHKLAVRGLPGMPFYHTTKKLANGRGKAEGSVFTWFKDLVTTGELSYNPEM